MSLRNLIDERRSVIVAGRRFRIRRPTVATVELCLELYGTEIEAIHRIAVQTQEPLTPELFLPVFTITGDARAERVLRTCIESIDQYDIVDWPVRELAEHMVKISDVARIAKSLGFQREAVPDDPLPEPPKVSDQHLAIVKLALKFGVTPFQIMDWPYEGFLDVLDTLPLLGEGGEAETSEQHHPDFVSEMRKVARSVEN